MRSEVDFGLQVPDLLQTWEREGLTTEKFLAVRQAGARMIRMFGMPSKTNITDFFISHTRDIAFDCKSFQDIDITDQQVGLVIEAIESIASFSKFPAEFQNIFLWRLWVKKLVLNPSDSLSHTLDVLAAIPVYIKRQISIDSSVERETGVVPQDHRRYLGQEEQGYIEVEESEDEGLREIESAIKSLPNEERAIILSLLNEAEDTEKKYGKSRVDDARNLLHERLYGQTYPKIGDTHVTHGSDKTLPLRESRKELAGLIEEIGLEAFFNRLARMNLDDKILITVLYYMGYFHSDENQHVFAANEKIHSGSLKQYIGKAIRELRKLPTNEGESLTIGELIQRMEEKSLQRRKGRERFPSPRSVNHLLEMVSNILTIHPDRQRRIKNRKQKQLISVLLSMPTSDIHDFIQFYKAVHAIQSMSGIHLTFVNTAVWRILERLIPETLLTSEKRLITSGGYSEAIIFSLPSPEQLAIINSDSRLASLYTFMKTPAEDGSYPSIELAMKELKVHKRVGTILIGILREDMYRIVSRSQINALKLLSLKLGASKEDLATDAQYIRRVRESLSALIAEDFSEAHIEDIASELGCPILFLCQVASSICKIHLPEWVKSRFGDQRSSLYHLKDLIDLVE